MSDTRCSDCPCRLGIHCNATNEVKELAAALKKSTRIMHQAEQLIASLNLHDKWHEQGKPHGAFHDLLFQRVHNQDLLSKIESSKT